HAFPKGERGKGMGLVAMIVGAGLLSGPLVGGYLVTLSWRWIFLAPLAFSWVAFVILPQLSEWREPEKRAGRLNIGSGAVLFVAIATFLYALKQLNAPGAGYPVMYASFAASLLAGVYFIYRESDPQSNLVGYDLFRNRNFSISVALMFLAFVCTSCVLILVPFFVERQLGMTPREAGMFLAVTPTIMLILAPLSGRLADKIGSRLPAFVGLSILTVGAYLLRGIQPERGVWGLLTPLIVFGVGMGIFGTPNSSDMMGSAPESKREIASGMLATTRSLSITFGVAISSALYVYWSATHGPIVAYQNVFTIATICAACAAGLSLFRQPGRR
ncbi:MAG TPA: MFS transporter, partial [candidate division Zixibacteria bacterium]|nr:MFS transporter [candidate division Zixibacteria bacterium]